ncbi:tetratricopeptide repeat protein [Zavarzinia compransoris]|uniref:Uncharacterized protein n=1 Tax=Zavarzinia compransoris TaxID=1264899 RepID=A0A317DZB1_9PROT|nr:tetratricopeptide repeat protein [Zavarzinia compransoris]PWR18225.1 hypothetical protein DKG75_19845 [Zavarzinia compransoris]
MVGRANKARDSGALAAAAELYGRWLEIAPKDFPVWVQRGNCLKDVHAFDDAMAAYGRAMALRPLNADLHLQIGHCLRMQGSFDEAVRSYARSALLDPSRPYAAHELDRLGFRVVVQEGAKDAQGIPVHTVEQVGAGRLEVYSETVTMLVRLRQAIGKGRQPAESEVDWRPAPPRSDLSDSPARELLRYERCLSARRS